MFVNIFFAGKFFIQLIRFFFVLLQVRWTLNSAQMAVSINENFDFPTLVGTQQEGGIFTVTEPSKIMPSPFRGPDPFENTLYLHCVCHAVDSFRPSTVKASFVSTFAELDAEPSFWATLQLLLTHLLIWLLLANVSSSSP